MKKTRLLSLALVVAVLLMGAGYALWSEALKIDGEICTGELDFAFTDVKFAEGTCYVMYDDAYAEEDGHTMVLRLDNVSPGATRTFDWCIKNTGTIGIKVVDIVASAEADAFEQVLIGTQSVQEYFESVLGGLEVIEPGEKECFSTVFTINVDAIEENFPEDKCFDFIVTASVTQSCPETNGEEPEPEPEPECPTGLTFEGSKTECSGYKCDKCYVDGELLYVFADGTTKSAGSIKQEIKCKNGSLSPVCRKYSEACNEICITFKTDKKGDLTWK